MLGPRERYTGHAVGPLPPHTYGVSDLDVEDPAAFQKACKTVLEAEEAIAYTCAEMESYSEFVGHTQRLARAHYTIREALRYIDFRPKAKE